MCVLLVYFLYFCTAFALFSEGEWALVVYIEEHKNKYHPMKRKKVLLGLFMAVSLLVSGAVCAQVNTGSKIVEVGPDNIGGRVTSLVVDQSDPTHQTIYAGAATGGLFVKSEDSERAPYANMWNYVPCVIDGQEIVLSISDMVQGPDNTIYIATGDGRYKSANRFESMTTLGQGLFKFNPTTKQFSRIPNTVPGDQHSPWAGVNKLAFLDTNNVMYFFAATMQGLYRWEISSESDWNNEPTILSPDYPIFDVMVVDKGDDGRGHNMLYYTTYNKIFRVGNVIENYIPRDITLAAIPAADNAVNIHLAVSPSDPNYVYAMVIKSNGLLEGVYMTKNQTTWTKLNTSTMTPFTVNDGMSNGAICVDPWVPNRVFVAGSSIWTGQGYSEGSYYQWVKNSLNENEFLSGNYMADIFSSASFVHSGINAIVSTLQEGHYAPTYYIATDGGVYVTDDEFGSYNNINQGLNNIQVNGLAVCTDGSLIAGAENNANIFIQSRMAHETPQGVTGTPSWYDLHPEKNTNHMGNVIFAGNGGQVAASMFQQYFPLTRRTLFTSSDRNLYGRAYADYADYTNTQTWTTDTNFLAKQIARCSHVPQMCLWESNNVQTSSDTLYVRVDTAAFLSRMLDGGKDTLIRMAPGTTILPGDRMSVSNKAVAEYPFDYVFQEERVITDTDTYAVKNILRSHLFVVSQTPNVDAFDVSMSWMPSDFRKVWYTGESRSDDEMAWAKVYTQKIKDTANYTIAPIAVSPDGDCLYIGVNDNGQQRSFLVRIKGITRNVDYTLPTKSIKTALEHGVSRITNPDTKLTCDTIRFNGAMWMPRRISSITFDQRSNSDMVIVTMQDRNASMNNVLRITGASTSNPVVTDLLVNNNRPAYTSMVEFTTGEVYVGTEDGAWVTSSQAFASTPSWERYGNFAGMPVTAMCQQIHELPILRHTVHAGISSTTNIYPRTKYPYAMYFGTYGRGIFMDSVYVVNHENEVVDSQAIVGIPTVYAVGSSEVKIYPNPVVDHATLKITLAQAGNVSLRVYDLSGRVVLTDNLGKKNEGVHTYSLNCQQLPKGMYLVNVISGRNIATSKMVVR